MFGFKKKKKKEVFVPVDGELILLEKVADPVFAQGMMGAGYAVEPANGKVYSPVVGKIASIFPTKHAVGLVMEDGTEVLVHLGIDTVELDGAGFTSYVNAGDKVDQDTKLISMDLATLKSNDKPATVMVLFPGKMGETFTINEGPVKKGEVVLELE